MKESKVLTLGTLTPAYGRDYKSFSSCFKDFRDGKDFKINYLGQETYCSIRDFTSNMMIKFRYHKLTKVSFYNLCQRDFEDN